MSNVLIGIIGVILFIGLALAGALILGDDFRSASSDTKAARAVAQLQQVTNAASMYQMKTGNTLPSGAVPDSPLMGRFLKTEPVAPTMGTNYPATFLMADDGSAAGAPARYVQLALRAYPADRPICEAIQRTTGQIGPSDPYDATIRTSSLATLPASQIGCFAAADRYFMYAKL